MPYADTDFFVRIANSDDRLNSRALKVLESYTGETYTSILTLVELALVRVRKEVHVEEMIASVLFIARLTGAGEYCTIVAAHPIEHEKAGLFDSFHASLCEDEIISSDHMYDKPGVKRAGSEFLQKQ